MFKVSVCIPTFNDVVSFERCLNSVITQNFRDIEIIISDDSNNEDIKRFVESFDFKEIPYSYFNRDVPLGSPENWNFSIKKAKGKYVKLLHHDDWFTYNTSLKTFVELIESNHDCSFAFVSSKNVKLLEKTQFNINKPSRKWIKKVEKNPFIIINANYIGSPSAIIHKNGLNIFYDKNLIWYVDVDFYVNLILNLNSKIAFTAIDAISIGIQDSQITRECENNPKIIITEFFYFLEKWKIIYLNDKKEIIDALIKIFLRFNIKNKNNILDYGFSGKLPDGLKKIFFLVFYKKILKKLKKWFL